MGQDTLIDARQVYRIAGIPPTGKEVAITDIVITRVEQDKIIELWAQFDVLGLFARLEET